MTEKLFEKFNSDVLTDELKSALTESFEEAVAEKVDNMVSEKVDTLVAEATVRLQESSAQETEDFKSDLVEHLSSYLEEVVEEWMGETQEDKISELEALKASAIVESFEAIGIEVGTITNDDKLEEREEKVSSLTEKVDYLINEKIELEKEVLSLNQGMLFEMLAADMTEMEKEKFEKLAETFVHITEMSTFKEKLELIKSSVIESKDKDEDEDEDGEDGEKPKSKKEDKKVEESMFKLDLTHL